MDISSLLPFLMMSGIGNNSDVGSLFGGGGGSTGGGLDLNQIMSMMAMMNGAKTPPARPASNGAPHRAATDFGGLSGMLSPEMIKLLMSLASK